VLIDTIIGLGLLYLAFLLLGASVMFNVFSKKMAEEPDEGERRSKEIQKPRPMRKSWQRAA
jgi:hypothetical protein